MLLLYQVWPPIWHPAVVCYSRTSGGAGWWHRACGAVTTGFLLRYGDTLPKRKSLVSAQSEKWRLISEVWFVKTKTINQVTKCTRLEIILIIITEYTKWHVDVSLLQISTSQSPSRHHAHVVSMLLLVSKKVYLISFLFYLNFSIDNEKLLFLRVFTVSCRWSGTKENKSDWNHWSEHVYSVDDLWIILPAHWRSSGATLDAGRPCDVSFWYGRIPHHTRHSHVSFWWIHESMLTAQQITGCMSSMQM